MSLVGRKVGQYQVLSEIGRGGMGEVYAAFDETLERRVALKSIRGEKRLEVEAKARFLREARILSQLEHPNICRIYDFVAAADVDLLVLELIEGRSLRQAIEAGLTEDEKLRIAEQLLNVLVAAHEKGIAHRDLKPDNVMVTPEGGVRVLDFGLARLVDDDRTIEFGSGDASGGVGDEEPTRAIDPQAIGYRSRHGLVVGTLGYMSPEQARGEAGTTASDIFSAGLILQQLFTGRAPWPKTSSVDEQLDVVSKARTLPVTGLDPTLTELIERMKDGSPARRPTALDASDRLAWARDRPRRHRRRRLQAGAMAGLAVIAAATVLFAIKATREADRANREAERASREARATQEVADFLVGLFENADPAATRGEALTVREVLDDGAARLDRELQESPSVKARLAAAMGRAYAGLGSYDRAAERLQRALEGLQDPADRRQRAGALQALADVRGEQGALAEAQTLLEEALEIRLEVDGENDPRTALTINTLGTMHYAQGRPDEAATFWRRALAIREGIFGPDHPDVAASLNNLAVLEKSRGQYDVARAGFERALAIRQRALGEDHPDTATSLQNLANLFQVMDLPEQAAPLYAQALAIREKVFGPDHPAVAAMLVNSANLEARLGRLENADAQFRRALAIWEAAFGPSHLYVAKTLVDHAAVCLAAGQQAEAETRSRRAVAIFEALAGPDSPRLAPALDQLAAALEARGRTAEAARLRQRSSNLQTR